MLDKRFPNVSFNIFLFDVLNFLLCDKFYVPMLLHQLFLSHHCFLISFPLSGEIPFRKLFRIDMTSLQQPYY